MGYQPPSGGNPYLNGLGGPTGYSAGFYRFPYSSNGAQFNMGGDSRPFANVGKWNINLAGPGGFRQQDAATNSGIPEMGGDHPNLFDGVPVLDQIDNYYGQPGGLLSGLFSAIGQTAGSLFGQGEAGSSIGATIGKTLEAPAVAVLNAPTPLAALSEEQRQGLRDSMPKLAAEYGAPTKVSDMLGSFLGVFGLMGRAVERTVAGMADEGNGALFGFLGRDMPEQYQQKVDSGEMTRDQALDQMVLDNAGYSDNPILNMMTSIVLDPMNLLSGGTGLAIKSLEATAKVGAGARIAARALGATDEIAHAAQLEATGSRAGLAAAIKMLANKPGGVQGILDGSAELDDASKVTVRLSRLERVGLATFGPLTTESNSTIAKIADATNNFASMGMNHLFGRSALGQQFNLDHLYTAGADGLVSGFGYNVVNDIVKSAEAAAPGGGDLFQKALAVGNGNIITRYVVDEIVGNALREGKIPKFSIAGSRVTATRMAQEKLVNQGLDPKHINEIVKTAVERNKPALLASKTMEQVSSDTVAKLADMLNADPAKVAQELGEVSLKKAETIHAAFYYEKGRRLHADVIPALKSVAANLLPPGFKKPELLTMISDRTLTNVRLTPIEAALKANDATELRSLVAKYDAFDFMDGEALSDQALIDNVDEWLTANRDVVIQEVPLVDASGNLLPNLPQPVRDWATLSEEQGYRLGLAPNPDAGDEAMYRITRGKDGRIKNWNAWVDFVHDTPGSVQLPNRFERHLKQVFGTYRNERIYWRNRRAFITHLSSDIVREPGDPRIPEAISSRIWDQVMRKSSEQGVTPRGLSQENFGEVVSNVMRSERARMGVAGQSVSDRQIMDATLKAFRGDFGLVGATQMITGAIKTSAPLSGQNYWGRLSEKLFPLMRFTLNPVFMGMEWTEVYILNAMRGISTPLRKGSDRFASAFSMQRATDQMLRSTLTKPDGSVMMQAEALEAYRREAVAAKQFLGSQTGIGKLFNSIPGIRKVTVGVWGDTYARKDVGRALLMQKVFGERLPAALKGMMGEENFKVFWRDLEDTYELTDPGEIAMSWVANNLALVDQNGVNIQRFHQIMNPRNFGQKQRIVRVRDPKDAQAWTHGDVADILDQATGVRNTMVGGYASRAGRAEELTRTTGEAWDSGRVLIDDITSGRLTREGLADELRRSGAAPVAHNDLMDLTNTVYNMAVGPTFAEFSRSMRTFAKGITGTTGVETRALRDEYVQAIEKIIQRRALSMGISADEFVGRRMGDVVQVMNDITSAPANVVRLLEQRTGLLEDLIRPTNHAIWENIPAPEVQKVALAATDDYVYRYSSAYEMDKIKGAVKYDEPNHLDAFQWSSADAIRNEFVMDHNPFAYKGMIRMKSSEHTVDSLTGEAWWNGYGGGDLMAKDVEVLTQNGEWVPVRDIGGGGPVSYPEVVPTPVSPERIGLSTYHDVEKTDPGALNRSPAAISEINRSAVISPEGLIASKFYEGSGYGEINSWLRGIEPYNGWTMTEDQIAQKVELLTEAAYKGVVTKPTTMWRGISIDRVEQEFGGTVNIAVTRRGKSMGSLSYLDLQPGDTFSDPAFLSFSENQVTSAEFARSAHHQVTSKQPAVMVWYPDVPPGTHANMIGGSETERVWPAGSEFEVVETIPSEWTSGYGATMGDYTGMPDQFRTDGDGVLIIKVRQVPGRGAKPGVQNIAKEEATLAEAANTEVLNTAVRDPAVLRRRAKTPAEDAEAVSLANAADASRHQNATFTQFGEDRVGRTTPATALDDIDRLLDSGEMQAALRSIRDFRDRFMTTFSETGQNMVAPFSQLADKALTLGVTPAPEAGLAHLLHQIEMLAGGRGEQVDETVMRGLSKGVSVSLSEPMTTRASDLMDVLSLNTSRRSDGRLTNLQPVWVDELARRGAGFVSEKDIEELRAVYGDAAVAHLIPDADNEFTHEAVVNYYNELARHANDTKYLGVLDWTAQDMASLSSMLAAKRTGRKGLALNSDVVRSNESTVSLVTKDQFPPLNKYDELLQIIFEPGKEAYRHDIQNHMTHFYAKQLRDLGVPVTAKRSGILKVVGGRPVEQTVAPLLLTTTHETTEALAGLLLATTRAEQTRSWRLVEGATDVGSLTPSIEVHLPQEAQVIGAQSATWYHGEDVNQDWFDKFTKNVMASTGLPEADRKLIEGALNVEEANGEFVLRVIDHHGVLPRQSDGALDEDWLAEVMKKTLDDMSIQPEQGWQAKYGVRYGQSSILEPPRRANGAPNWTEYERVLEQRLADAGLGRVTGDELRRLRTEAYDAYRTRVRAIAPQQARRAERGEPLVPHVLEEQRGGDVLGATVLGEHAAVIEAFKKGDAVTGLHELVHVLARDLDPSMKRVVMESRASAFAARRTDVAQQAAALRQRALTATTPSVASRFNNRATRLEAGLGDLVDEADWGVEHEEYFVGQMLRWFRTGTVDTGNADPTDFVHAVNYMRNHIEGVWKDVKGTRDPSEHASPEMERLLNRMFNGTPPLEAVNYNVTDTAVQLAMRQQLGAAFDEAHTTHVFKKDRSFLERSINHPYIGVYPASYMWGKLLPEMIAFLAIKPFGLTAPMLGWNVVREVSDSIRAQQETDPNFNKFLTDNKQIFQLAAMLFPALPHDIPANAALPFRRIAEQGLNNQVAYANGEDPTPIDYAKGASDALFYALGPAGATRTAGQLPGQLSDLFGGQAAKDQGVQITGPSGLQTGG